MYRQVLLVRHAMPILIPEQPAGSWALGDEGKGQAAGLVERLLPLAPDLVVTSIERKARETGDVIAAGLGQKRHIVDGFHEQGGDTVPFIDDPAAFRASVERHFTLSDRAVLGTETPHDAARRFATALDRVANQFPLAQRPLVVSHGRIMAAFLGQLTGRDPWEIWRELALPDLFRVDLEAGRFDKSIQGGPIASPLA